MHCFVLEMKGGCITAGWETLTLATCFLVWLLLLGGIHPVEREYLVLAGTPGWVSFRDLTFVFIALLNDLVYILYS